VPTAAVTTVSAAEVIARCKDNSIVLAIIIFTVNKVFQRLLFS
jgi:hypothetical protein